MGIVWREAKMAVGFETCADLVDDKPKKEKKGKKKKKKGKKRCVTFHLFFMFFFNNWLALTGGTIGEAVPGVGRDPTTNNENYMILPL